MTFSTSGKDLSPKPLPGFEHVDLKEDFDMRLILKRNQSRLEFDSVADLLATVVTHRDVRHLRSIEDYPDYFGDVRSVDHLFDLARVGWEAQLGDTLTVAERTLATVERAYDVPMWQSYYDVNGADVDVARYLSGEPENMISYHMAEIPRSGRVVSLAVNVGASSDISADDVVKRGKSVVALVYALENMGLRTELYADSQSKSLEGGPETGRVVVKVKDAADALDPAMVMFALAHPSFLRGMMLGAMHEHPERFQKSLNVGGGYGRPTKGMPNDVFPDGCIVLQTVMRSGDNVTDAEEFVVKHLKELGLI